jgi:uncharacterized protein YciI
VSDVNDEIASLAGAFIARRLFVCRSGPAEDSSVEQELALLADHLRYLISLEQRGVLFASGPILEAGQPGRLGVTILRADDAEHARALLAEDPFHQAGLRTSTVEEWSLNQGRITLHVDFSCQAGGLDGLPPRVSE